MVAIIAVQFVSGQTNPIIWDPAKVNITLGLGDTKELIVSFKSKTSMQNVDLWIVPELQPFVRIEPSHFDIINADAKYNVLVHFSIPLTSKKELFEGTVHLRVRSVTYPQTLKINLNVVDAIRTIGPEGGIVSTPDSKFIVEIPVNAVLEQTQITILETNLSSNVGPGYQLSPSGITFLKPVKIVYLYDSSNLAPDTNESELYLVTLDEYINPLDNIEVYPAEQKIVGTTEHFSFIYPWKDEPTGVKVSDLPLTREFRMPIGDIRDGIIPAWPDTTPNSELDKGNKIEKLSIHSYQDFIPEALRSNYPMIRFNDSDASNRWYVSVAFNQNTWLANGRDSGLTGDYGDLHPGEDWSIPGEGDAGKPIHAVADGIVLLNQTQWLSNLANTIGFGNIIVLGHRISDREFVLSVYGHMKAASPCPVGGNVKRGDIIGLIDHTGKSDGSHLHFEIAKMSRVSVDQNSGAIKLRFGPITESTTGQKVGEYGWYWTGGKDQSYVNAYYYHPSNFLKNMAGKSNWEFKTNENTEGWSAHNFTDNKVNGQIDDGIFYVAKTKLDSNNNYDPYISSSPLSIKANNFNSIEVRMASNTSNQKGAIYYKTQSDDNYDDNKRVEFTVNTDTAYHAYPIYLAGDLGRWQGTITGIRIDPSNDTSINPGQDSIGFDYIRFANIVPVNPTASIVSPQPPTGPSGTQFLVQWSGFTKNGSLTSHLKRPDGTEFPTETYPTDSEGKANHAINSAGFSAGAYEHWAVDDLTGKTSNIVSFAITSIVPNSPPNTPSTPTGPSSGIPGTSYNFATSATDPDGDALVYQFSWGDGSNPSWGSSAQSHSWSLPGTYSISAKARDEHGAISSWSSAKDISIGAQGLSVILPKTGQRTCFDELGNVIDCTGTGQDGEIQAGLIWPEPRFLDNGNETITDRLTGLVWTKCANLAGYLKTWSETLDYIRDMNAGIYQNYGYSDWRLPNIIELESLANSGEISVDWWLMTQGFSNVSGYAYWSSTTNPNPVWQGNTAMGIMMGNGMTFDDMKYQPYYVWPVRGTASGPAKLRKTGQTVTYYPRDDGEIQAGTAWPFPRFTDNQNGTATDNLTGLIWINDANVPGPASCNPGVAKSWKDALNHVKCLNASNYLGFNDWRLPNRKEIFSLVDFSQSLPALPPGHFFYDGQLAHWYWTSTTVMSLGNYGWEMENESGRIAYLEKPYKLSFLVVRGGLN